MWQCECMIMWQHMSMHESISTYHVYVVSAVEYFNSDCMAKYQYKYNCTVV